MKVEKKEGEKQREREGRKKMFVIFPIWKMRVSKGNKMCGAGKKENNNFYCTFFTHEKEKLSLRERERKKEKRKWGGWDVMKV